MRKTNNPCHEPVDHTRQLPRLRRIEGQVRGLQQMITDQRYCIDVINQMDAMAAALRRVQSDMLRDHIVAVSQKAVSAGVSAQDRQNMADEVAELLKRR